jgi:hypothetical protein
MEEVNGVKVSNDAELATMFAKHKEKGQFHVRLQNDGLCRHLDLLGQNHVVVMAALARTVQDLQLVHGDVVARQAWAPAVGSPKKWSLTM